MKSHSSTTRSKRRFRRFVLVCQALALVAATGIVSPGCAVHPPPGAQAPAPAVPLQTPPEKPTLLTLEYGNRSSKASLQIDLSSTDVQLDMSGSRPPKDTAARTAAKPAGSTATEPSPQPAAAAVAEDEGTQRARRLVESTRVQPGEAPDSTVRKVVQLIRRSQEMFYAGRYAEAEDNARRANELKPTAEGLALAGSISWVRKDRQTARRHWQAARELDPDFPGLAEVLDSAAPRQELSP
jgi:hypothetical protein